MKKSLSKLIFIAISLYLLGCVAVYCFQSQLLFPANMAKPVGQYWVPSISKNDEQALLEGACGKLHVVRWVVAHEKGTVMIFHGNGESVASVEDYVPWLQKFGYSVMAWDYPGYGQSANCLLGSEHDLLQNSETAYQWLAKRVPVSNITIFGRSVGSGLAVYIASRHTVKRLILVSAYDELVKVSADNMPFFVPVRLLTRYPILADAWIGQVKSPIYAVHGSVDSLIKPARVSALIAHAPKVHANVSLKWVVGAGHDVASYPEYEAWLTQVMQN